MSEDAFVTKKAVLEDMIPFEPVRIDIEYGSYEVKEVSFTKEDKEFNEIWEGIQGIVCYEDALWVMDVGFEMYTVKLISEDNAEFIIKEAANLEITDTAGNTTVYGYKEGEQGADQQSTEP